MKNTNEVQKKEYIYDLSYCNFEYLRKRQINKSNEQWECGKRILLLCFLIIFNLLYVLISPFIFPFLCLSYFSFFVPFIGLFEAPMATKHHTAVFSLPPHPSGMEN